jgi:hypothetical protein
MFLQKEIKILKYFANINYSVNGNIFIEDWGECWIDRYKIIFPYFTSIFFSFCLLLCWVGVHCGFTKVLTMYQIYHTWIHPSAPLYCSTLSSLPQFLEQFELVSFLHLHTCVHILPRIWERSCMLRESSSKDMEKGERESQTKR